ncbi:MAG: hypothetical protein U0939_22700 [Pirellulales bacterium]
MTRTGDAGKRAEWESRLRRYRISGLAVEAFCTRESVSVASFYYWSRRLGGHHPKAMNSPGEAIKSAIARSLEVDVNVVRFYLPAGVEIFVPAARLDVVRCLAECLSRATSVAGPAFREVVVKQR